MEKHGLDYLIDMLNNQILQSDHEISEKISSTWVAPQEKEMDLETQY